MEEFLRAFFKLSVPNEGRSYMLAFREGVSEETYVHHIWDRRLFEKPCILTRKRRWYKKAWPITQAELPLLTTKDNVHILRKPS